MSRSTLLLFISSLFAFSLVSCKAYDLGNVNQADAVPAVNNEYFSDPQVDYIYKASITAYGRQFGGILILKKTSDTSYRTVMSTDFGNKLIDATLNPSGLDIHSVIDGLNRKIIIRTLEKDFRALLKATYPVNRSLQNDSFLIYDSKEGSEHYYLFLDKQQIRRIAHTGKRKKLTTFEFGDIRNNIAGSIRIIHHNIQLEIGLKAIME